MAISNALLLLTLLGASAADATDYAAVEQREDWLRHPVLGDPSFDAFERRAGNPIHEGTPPYEWPVNGFLFKDPVSGNWYVYVGEYLSGYQLVPDQRTRCIVLRSKDQGASWENLGPILEDEHYFQGETSPLWNAPDVTVLYDGGRYHMAFDWTTRNTTWENAANPGQETNSGSGYAWAEAPEGPWHPAETPIATTRDLGVIGGKYRRIYASTLIRRQHDWLVLSLADSQAYFGWGLTAMTAPTPEGPYTAPELVLHPELPRFLPPLLEYFPAFVHEGFIYAPATSVATNRNYQALFRAPIERATDSEAWELVQHGSFWHSEPKPEEHFGIWGQTLTGFVSEGVFHVMFPSRNAENRGTINLARRPWDKPFQDRGFVISAHAVPSLTLLKHNVAPERVVLDADVLGEVTLFWGGDMPLGPEQPRSNAAPHPLSLQATHGLRLTPDGTALLGGESFARPEDGPVTLLWKDEALRISAGDDVLWEGPQNVRAGAIGLQLAPHSHAEVRRFEVQGAVQPGARRWLYTEGLLGAAQNLADWDVVQDDGAFRYGMGAISKDNAIGAKWNVEGDSFALWAPKRPDFGKATLWIDDERAAELDFSADAPQDSAPVFEGELPDRRCSVRLLIEEGRVPVDCLEVTDLP